MQDKKFISDFEKNVKKTIKQYNLISKKDKLAAAVSGGKDSTTVLHILDKLGYKPQAITVDALIGNYTAENLENIKSFCKARNIKLHIISFREEFGYSLCYLKSVLNKKGANLKSCTICGVLRRYLINKYSKKLGFTKLATGHNKDDEAQAIIMNLLRNDVEMLARLGPITSTKSRKSFVPRIKPLYLSFEKDIEKYSKLHNFPVNYNVCPCRSESYRNFMRQMIKEQESHESKLKDNVISKFLSISSYLKKEFLNKGKLKECTRCGEPTKESLCMACKIISRLT